MPRRDYSKEEMFTEPDPSSDNEDAEFLDEVFDMYEHTGVKSEQLTGKERRDYEKWLTKQRSTGNTVRPLVAQNTTLNISTHGFLADAASSWRNTQSWYFRTCCHSH
jgi:hypothetical protein